MIVVLVLDRVLNKGLELSVLVNLFNINAVEVSDGSTACVPS